MNNDDQNELMLWMQSFIQMAKPIARAQKEYFDELLGQGFSEDEALYLCYHYNPLLFTERNVSGDDDNEDNSGGGY